MTSLRNLKVVHQDDALSACFFADSVFLLVWRRPINLASVQALGTALEKVMRGRTTKVALLSVVSPEAQTSFEGSARQLNVQLILRYQHTLTTAVAVVEGGGPRAALLRAATRLVLLASPRWLNVQIRAEVSVGCQWLADHFGSLEGAELTAAIDLMRHSSGRVAV